MWFVPSLLPYFKFFTSSSSFILTFLTIIIISVCSDFKVCRKECESGGRKAEAVRFSCGFWDLPTILIKNSCSKMIWSLLSFPNAAKLCRKKKKKEKPKASLQRITFCFQVLRLSLLFMFKTFCFYNARAMSSLACRDVIAMKVFPFAHRQLLAI